MIYRNLKFLFQSKVVHVPNFHWVDKFLNLSMINSVIFKKNDQHFYLTLSAEQAGYSRTYSTFLNPMLGVIRFDCPRMFWWRGLKFRGSLKHC
jgi:hypothetical protein